MLLWNLPGPPINLPFFYLILLPLCWAVSKVRSRPTHNPGQHTAGSDLRRRNKPQLSRNYGVLFLLCDTARLSQEYRERELNTMYVQRARVVLMECDGSCSSSDENPEAYLSHRIQGLLIPVLRVKTCHPSLLSCHATYHGSPKDKIVHDHRYLDGKHL